MNLEQLEKQSIQVETEMKIGLPNVEKVLGIGASFTAAIVIALNPIVQGVLNSIISLLTAIVPSIITISWQYKKNTFLQSFKSSG